MSERIYIHLDVTTSGVDAHLDPNCCVELLSSAAHRRRLRIEAVSCSPLHSSKSTDRCISESTNWLRCDTIQSLELHKDSRLYVRVHIYVRNVPSIHPNSPPRCSPRFVPFEILQFISPHRSKTCDSQGPICMHASALQVPSCSIFPSEIPSLFSHHFHIITNTSLSQFSRQVQYPGKCFNSLYNRTFNPQCAITKTTYSSQTKTKKNAIKTDKKRMNPMKLSNHANRHQLL